MVAEVAGLWPQAKGHLELLDIGRDRKDPPLELQREYNPAHSLTSDSGLWICETIKLCCFSNLLNTNH